MHGATPDWQAPVLVPRMRTDHLQPGELQTPALLLRRSPTEIKSTEVDTVQRDRVRKGAERTETGAHLCLVHVPRIVLVLAEPEEVRRYEENNQRRYARYHEAQRADHSCARAARCPARCSPSALRL